MNSVTSLLLYQVLSGKHNPRSWFYFKNYIYLLLIWKLKSKARAVLKRPLSWCFDDCNHRVKMSYFLPHKRWTMIYKQHWSTISYSHVTNFKDPWVWGGGSCYAPCIRRKMLHMSLIPTSCFRWVSLSTRKIVLSENAHLFYPYYI